jgi:hypothetical protein
MKVTNMKNEKGRSIPNQFIVSGEKGEFFVEYFQSYDSKIIKRVSGPHGTTITLDRDTWDYSVTTGKYRNIFLGETKKETQKKIDDGEYLLMNLNS